MTTQALPILVSKKLPLFHQQRERHRFYELSEDEKMQFYKCQQCGEMDDMRQLDDVLFHEDHAHRPDIQYGGSKEI
jgi:Fe2+ or Zn2+ uptake regulation protein